MFIKYNQWFIENTIAQYILDVHIKYVENTQQFSMMPMTYELVMR